MRRSALIFALVLLAAPAAAQVAPSEPLPAPPPRLAAAHWWMARQAAKEGEQPRAGEDTGLALAAWIRPIQAHRYVWAGGAVGQKTIGPAVGFSAEAGKALVGAGVGFVWDYDSTGVDFGRGRAALGVTLTWGSK